MNRKKMTDFLSGLVIILVIFLIMGAFVVWGKNDSLRYDEWFDSKAEGTIIIENADRWSVFQKRTKEEIGLRYEKAKFDLEENDVYLSVPVTREPYAAGEISEKALRKMLDMVNYYRWLAGEDELGFSMEYQADMQAVALYAYLTQKQEAGNEVEDNFSGQPENATDLLYKNGIWPEMDVIRTWTTFTTAISDCINIGVEGGEAAGIKERLAVLDPLVSRFEWGYCSGVFAGKVKYAAEESGSKFRYSYVAYPSPGYFPANEIDKELSSWHIQLNPSMLGLQNSSRVNVVITDLNHDISYVRTIADGSLVIEGSVLSFLPPFEKGNLYSHNYRVEVEGIRTISGSPVILRYTVRFFDRREYEHSEVKSVSSFADKIVTSTGVSDNVIFSVLPDELDIVLENGRKFAVPVDSWITECYNNSSTLEDIFRASVISELPDEYVSDSNGQIGQYTISIVKDEPVYRIYTNNKEMMEGKRLSLTVCGDEVPDDEIEYTWYFQKNDGTIRKLSQTERTLVIEQYTEENAGEYYAVFSFPDEPGVSYLTAPVKISTSVPSAVYKGYVQDSGWGSWEKNGEMCGTIQEGKRLEGIIIELENLQAEGSVSYRSYMQSSGWQEWTEEGETSGITDSEKRMEAFQVKLTGVISYSYDIYYRAYVEEYGWLGWAKNGESAGSVGLGKRMEAVEILLVKKGEFNKNSDKDSLLAPEGKSEVIYQMKGKDGNWQTAVKDGQICGSIGESNEIMGLKIVIEDSYYTGGVEYQVYIRKKGWQDWMQDGKDSTEGNTERTEAVRIRLTGEMKVKYDIYYRVHVQDYGWLDWTKNGMTAGTEGLSKRMEAIEVCLIKKGGEAPGETKCSVIVTKAEPVLSYRCHIQSYGWQEMVTDGLAGTVEESFRMEALQIKLSKADNSSVLYRAYMQSYGWQDWVKDGETAGMTGRAKRLEAVEIKLTGELSRDYDVYYRSYVQGYGWLGWAKNGFTSGSLGTGKRLEAIEIRLVKKGGAAPGTEAMPCINSGNKQSA